MSGQSHSYSPVTERVESVGADTGRLPEDAPPHRHCAVWYMEVGRGDGCDALVERGEEVREGWAQCDECDMWTCPAHQVPVHTPGTADTVVCTSCSANHAADRAAARVDSGR